jgi:hypothetical protein
VPAFVPVFVAQGVKDWWLIAALLGWTAILVMIALTAMRGYLPRSRMWIAAFGNLGIAYIQSRILGPFVIPPAVAVVTAMQVTTHPNLKRWWLVAAILSIGPAGAWALEASATIAPLMRAEDGRLVLGSTLVDLPWALSTVAMVGFALAVVTTATLFGRRLAHAHDTARRALAVQAWHLRRLVGGDKS